MFYTVCWVYSLESNNEFELAIGVWAIEVLLYLKKKKKKKWFETLSYADLENEFKVINI